MQYRSVFVGLLALGTLLWGIATLYYPGGSVVNPAQVGYDWDDNYLSNLLQPVALNGAVNAARPWAVAGAWGWSLGFAVFFWGYAPTLPYRSAVQVVRYGGVLAAALAAFSVVPAYHDQAITLSIIPSLLVFFYLTVFAFRTKLTWLKVLSVAGLGLYYVATFMFFSRSLLAYMPIMQKALHLVKIVWVLALAYGVRREDFGLTSPVKAKVT